jgi:hypothetical protein
MSTPTIQDAGPQTYEQWAASEAESLQQAKAEGLVEYSDLVRCRAAGFVPNISLSDIADLLQLLDRTQQGFDADTEYAQAHILADHCEAELRVMDVEIAAADAIHDEALAQVEKIAQPLIDDADEKAFAVDRLRTIRERKSRDLRRPPTPAIPIEYWDGRLQEHLEGLRRRQSDLSRMHNTAAARLKIINPHYLVSWTCLSVRPTKKFSAKCQP